MSRVLWILPLVLILLGWSLWRTPVDLTDSPTEGSAQRIVSLAPSLTDLVLALGGAERLVGVTRFCEGVDPAVRRVGDIRFDVEAILSLHPDRVLAIVTQSQSGLRKALTGRGITIDVLPAESVADVRAALERLGEILEAPDRAQSQIEAIDRALVVSSVETPVRGIFVVERQSLTVAGGGSFVDEMLIAAGIENAFGAESFSYRSVELETIARLDPVIILDASFSGSESTDPISFWSRFPSLQAVEDGGVVSFPPVRPGVGIPGWVEQLREEARSRRE